MSQKTRSFIENSLATVLITLLLNVAAPQALAQQSNIETAISDASQNTQQNPNLSQEQKQMVLSELDEAQKLLGKAQQQREIANAYETQAETAPQTIAEIEKHIQQTKDKSFQVNSNKSIAALENQLLLAEAEQNARFTNISQAQSEQTSLSLRSNEIAQDLSTVRANTLTIQNAIDNKEPTKLSALENSKFLKQRANVVKLNATAETLQRELATIPARQLLLDAQMSKLAADQKFHEQQIAQLRTFLSATKSSEVERTVLQATSTLQELSAHPALAEIARTNLAFAQQIADLQSGSTASEQSTSRLISQLQEVQQSAQTVERVLATGRVTDELGKLLRKLRASLPRSSVIEARKSEIEEDAVRHQLNVILWQERVRNLQGIPSAAKQLLIENTPNTNNTPNLQDDQPAYNFSTFQLANAQVLITNRLALLDELIELSKEQSDQIIEEKLVINQLLSISTSLQDSLERRLIWLPSNSGEIGNFISNFKKGLNWLVSPGNWWGLMVQIYTGILSISFLSLALLISALSIVLSRATIKQNLWSLVDRVGNVEKDTFLATPFALLLTLILALPLPLFLFAIATLIFKGSEALSFNYAIATGLSSVSSISLALLFFRSMSRDHGLFEKHFSWSETARLKLRSMLGWFVWVQSLAAFVFASAMVTGDMELRYSMALSAFIIGSIGIVIFSYQFFRPKTGVASNIVGETPPGLLATFAFPVVVFTPLIIGLLPLFGFFETAIELQSRVFTSGILLVFSAVFYGIILRIFLVAFRRYSMKKAHLHAIKTNEARIQAQKDIDDNVVSSQNNDEDAGDDVNDKEVMSQSRSIILWITALFFVAGLWFVWRSLLPALGIVDEIVLWQEVTLVDGVELSSGITLWNIITGFGFVIGGFVAAKNIRGVMEIGFFEKLDVEAGARYAIITILGYILVATGIVVGFSQLGIEWSKLQWIVAALGVGLGFGLQEIVANFVSGLIILFERPIRVGDFVTIGNLSGTVSNIKIRATTITDFDNREVLLPNKSIITENVTNWTLKDAVTRVVIKIGVAYGSDIDAVRNLLMQAVKAQNDVLQHPAPQVFFLEHGDSSLNFEVRVFVSRPQERLPLTHAINTAINNTLAEHNISIPFPQRDLHIMTQK